MIKEIVIHFVQKRLRALKRECLIIDKQEPVFIKALHYERYHHQLKQYLWKIKCIKLMYFVDNWLTKFVNMIQRLCVRWRKFYVIWSVIGYCITRIVIWNITVNNRWIGLKRMYDSVSWECVICSNIYEFKCQLLEIRWWEFVSPVREWLITFIVPSAVR